MAYFPGAAFPSSGALAPERERHQFAGVWSFSSRRAVFVLQESFLLDPAFIFEDSLCLLIAQAELSKSGPAPCPLASSASASSGFFIWSVTKPPANKLMAYTNDPQILEYGFSWLLPSYRGREKVQLMYLMKLYKGRKFKENIGVRHRFFWDAWWGYAGAVGGSSCETSD